MKLIICATAVFILMFVLTFFCGLACAANIDGHTEDQWANAIYKSEGGGKTRHPYGILAHYKHTSYRQACKNTVAHQYRNWLRVGHPGVFLRYLARHYAPIGVSNDPGGLNRNWAVNVGYWLKKG